MQFKLPNLAESAAALRWARRLLLLQGRLRSNEPTQILVCASFGAVIGALIAGLHWLVDWIHHIAFHISGDHSLSAGIGVDSARILIVPALGGLALGVGALVMRRYRPNDVVDPIEANALHGGRMSMKDSLRLLIATVWSNGSGVSAAWKPATASSARWCWPRLGNISACAARISASSSRPAPGRPSPRPSIRPWLARSMATN